MTTETVWVAGVGGIGSVVSYKLAAGGKCRVLALDGWREHVDAINRDGLRLKGQFDDEPVGIDAVHLDDLASRAESPSFIFIAAKSQDTDAYARALDPWLESTATVVSLQNGLNVEALSDVFGAERVIGGVVLIDGSLEGPAIARQERGSHGTAGLIIGEIDGAQSQRLERVADLLGDVTPIRITDNIVGELWSKLIRNCLINAVCATTGRVAGETVRIEPVRRLAIRLAGEATRMALATGVELVPELLFGYGPDEWAADVPSPQLDEVVRNRYPDTEKLPPSMLQDVRKGRRTEIDFMNGYIARNAPAAGVDARLSAAITEIVHRIERNELRPGAGELSGSEWAERLLENGGRVA